MVARVRTVAFQGVDTLDIDVQVHMGNGLPAFSIVGLPAKAVDESKDRVRAALSALGLALPPQRGGLGHAPPAARLRLVQPALAVPAHHDQLVRLAVERPRRLAKHAELGVADHELRPAGRVGRAAAQTAAQAEHRARVPVPLEDDG